MRGAHAEYMAVSQNSAIAHMPSNISFDEAVDLSYGAGTAVTFLENFADLQPGESIAIVGAAGGVGRYAIQVAKHHGAHVSAVCNGKDTHAVRNLGADRVVDYTREDFTTTRDTYDVIFDTSGTVGFSECKHLLEKGGRFLSLDISLSLLAHMVWTRLFGSSRAITGVSVDSRESAERVRKLVESGALQPTVGRSFSLDELADAHRHLESDHPRGSVVVSLSDPATG